MDGSEGGGSPDGSQTVPVCTPLNPRHPLTHPPSRSKSGCLASYASDALKINIDQIFKVHSPHTELKTL